MSSRTSNTIRANHPAVSRPWSAGLCVLGLALAVAGWAAQPATPSKTGKVAAPAASRASGEQPTMLLTRVRAELSRQGQVRQSIRTEWARLDETDRVLYMHEIQLEFFDNGRLKGEAVSGDGTMWLLPQPDRGIGRNDLELSDGVTYRSAEGWNLVSPSMHFDNERTLLRSDSGFTKQFKAGDDLIQAVGQGFEIKLALERGTLESMKEFGNPVVYDRIEKHGSVSNP